MSVDDFRRLVQELYLEADPPALPVRNVAILVDCSASMERGDPHLARVKEALTRFAARLAAHAAQGMRLNVCLIGFSEKITAFFSAEAFTDFAARPDDPFYEAIQALATRGGTNYQAALHKAGAWLAQHSEAQAGNSVFFISDGKPTCYCYDAFTHNIAPSRSGSYVYNGVEFAYDGKGRTYYDAQGHAVHSGSSLRRCRASERDGLEVRVGSSSNWSACRAVFTPDIPGRRVSCMLAEYYVPGQIQYFDATGKSLQSAGGAAYRISANGNFEQYRKGAWHAPADTVIATALDSDGVAHPHLTTRVLGGSGVSSGALETGTALYARRKILDSAQSVSLYAIGIGGAVDPALLGAFDTTAQATMLADAGQLAAALSGLADGDFGALSPAAPTDIPQDMAQDGFDHEGFAQDGFAHDDVTAESAGATRQQAAPDAPAQAEEFAAAFHGDGGLLAQLGSELLEDDAVIFPDAFPAAPAESATEVRHFNLAGGLLQLHDLFGEDATLDFLLTRITASQESRTINGESVADLVLHVHSGDGDMTPIVHTIVLEGYTPAYPDVSDDLQTLLQHILHS